MLFTVCGPQDWILLFTANSVSAQPSLNNLGLTPFLPGNVESETNCCQRHSAVAPHPLADGQQRQVGDGCESQHEH